MDSPPNRRGSFIHMEDQILISLLTLHVNRLEPHSPRCSSLIPELSRMHKARSLETFWCLSSLDYSNSNID